MMEMRIFQAQQSIQYIKQLPTPFTKQTAQAVEYLLLLQTANALY